MRVGLHANNPNLCVLVSNHSVIFAAEGEREREREREKPVGGGERVRASAEELLV